MQYEWMGCTVFEWLEKRVSNGELILDGYQFANLEVASIGRVLQEKSEIRFCGITQANLDDIWAEKIWSTLATVGNVETLQLSRNAFGDAGITYISHALSVNTSIRKLDLSYNQFGDIGLVSLAVGITKNTSLKEIRLNGLRFGNAGIRAFAEALVANTSLRVVNLEDTEINAGGLAYLRAIENRRPGISFSGISLALDRNP